MARRLNRILSSILSAAIVVLSLGLDAQQAVAQTFTGRSAPVSPAPQLGLGSSISPAPALSPAALSLTAPSLLAPSLASPLASPVAAAQAAPIALKPATPAAAIAEKLAAASPILQAVAKPETGGASAATAGRALEDVLTGGRSAASKGDAEAVAGVTSALSPVLSAASAPEAPKAGAAVPAAAPAPAVPLTAKNATSYKWRKAALKAVAALTGAVFSAPQMSAAHTAQVIASAADKQLVISDFDDTLAAYNAVLPEEKIAAIRAIRAAGKHFAVVSDRGDEKRKGSTQLTVFESLASLPKDVTEGMYVAANSGGRLYQYRDGVPVKVWEAEPLEAAKLETVKEAAAATKARLSEAGVEQHPGDSLNPAESFNTYGYAMMIKVGADSAQMKQVAEIMREELLKRGIDVEVSGRLPKDLANPGYATFSIITKTPATAKIAELLKIAPSDAIGIGDMMFVPRKPKKESWLTKLGLRLSGLPLADVGNETDRNLSKGIPGGLILGVGNKMDPRIPNGWNLAGHGPSVTQKVLESVASKPARLKTASADDDKVGTGIQLGILALIVGMGALGWYTLASVIGDLISMGERALREGMEFGPDMGFFLGATTLGMVGMLGHTHRLLTDPNDTFSQALKSATEAAAGFGAKAADVRFVEATASTPVHQGSQWKYTFSAPNEKGGTNLIYVDFDNFLGGAQDFRTRVYEGAVAPVGAIAFAMTPVVFKLGVKVGPENALDLLRKALPAFGGGASVSLGVEEDAATGDRDAWYRFYDDHGNVGKVNARTGEALVVKTAPEKGKKAAAPGLTTAVAPNELYALALANITAKAAETGVSAGDIRLLSAVHETRYFNGAWVGDEWRFFFGWGSERGGVEYMVPARRTMITETMMDAFEPKLVETVSAQRLKDGIPAGLFDRAVVVAPETALKGVDGVARVSLLPRVEPVSGDKDLWYSLQDSGAELASVNARTGEVRKGEPRSPNATLGSFVAWLIGAALVALIYGGLYWAMTNAPAAVPQGVPDGYNGPIPSIDDVFRGMGGMLGFVGLAGVLRAKKAKLSDDDVRSAAAGVISMKGRPWSQTEFNASYYPALENLKRRGATKAQVALFEKLVADAPIKGGSFNPWSGD
ncbi:MAG: hypothetical protein M0D55_09095 [Elusimicrobiota bacterium]|nr:MAG: hypothetical protein M0D55_09095 [Elusimicrobiota bacterium]